MSKAQELADALDRMDNLLNPEYRLLSVPGDSATAVASRADMALIRAALSASSEQQAAQQDAKRWRAFSQGAVFPKLAFNNGNSHWQYGEIRGLSANAVADLVIAARASNGGKA